MSKCWGILCYVQNARQLGFCISVKLAFSSHYYSVPQSGLFGLLVATPDIKVMIVVLVACMHLKHLYA